MGEAELQLALPVALGEAEDGPDDLRTALWWMGRGEWLRRTLTLSSLSERASRRLWLALVPMSTRVGARTLASCSTGIFVRSAASAILIQWMARKESVSRWHTGRSWIA